MINRKRMLIILASLVIFCVVALLFLFLLPGGEDKEMVPQTLPDEVFYSPDFEADIMNDPEYLALNRVISYRNGAITYTVAPEEYESTDKILAFIAELTDIIISGSYEKYPEFFSDNFKNEYDLPEKFTMQRLYNITIEKISEDSIIEDGVIRPRYVYMLEYMISKNDGTFRRDIDSDSSRPQYLVITEREGRVEIDEIITYIEQ